MKVTTVGNAQLKSRLVSFQRVQKGVFSILVVTQHVVAGAGQEKQQGEVCRLFVYHYSGGLRPHQWQRHSGRPRHHS